MLLHNVCFSKKSQQYSYELTWTLQVAAITPSTGVSEKGSNVLSDRRMKSGFNRYLSTEDNKSNTQINL